MCSYKHNDLEQQAKYIRKLSKKLVKQGPEACRKFLISTGAYNEDGTLKDTYK